MDLPAGSMGIDMNDSATLSLYSELVRFQIDLSIPELRFSQPCAVTQRALHLFAHGLALQYEYFLSSQEARISRGAASNVFEPGTPELEVNQAAFGRRDSDAATTDSSLDVETDPLPCITTTESEEVRRELEFDTFCFDVDDVPEIAANFDWIGDDGEIYVEKPGILPPQHVERLDTYPELQSYQGSLQFSHLLYDQFSQTAIGKPLDPAQLEIEHGVLSPHFSCHGICYDHSALCAETNDQLNHSPLDMASSSIIIGQEDICASLSDAALFSFRQAGSGAGSISSVKGGRGRNRVSKQLKRNSSIFQLDKSTGFQELVLDLRPTRSSSASTGRQGPLGAIARAAMKAVAAAGACWRCKFLRKQCDTGTTCDACPKSSPRSPWRLVGCNRGTIKTVMFPITLCQRPNSGASIPPTSLETQKYEVICLRANGYSHQAIKRRPEHTPLDLAPISLQNAEIDPVLQSLIDRWPSLNAFRDKRISSINNPFQPMLIPHDECILAILWEAFDCPLSQRVVGNPGHALVLMRAAALFQVKADADQLIAKSLVCLRACLEALRLKYSGFLDIVSHRSCDQFICKIDCIAQLNSALTKYLAELSQVFFKKENMRSKSWRLSVFYSFCIQSIVRKALISLVGVGGSFDSSLGARKYLHLAVRLFVASSGTFDPLMEDFSMQSYESGGGCGTRVEDYKLAQYAVQQANWISSGTNSTATYLKHIFEDDGQDVIAELHAGEPMADDSQEDDTGTLAWEF